MIDFEISAEDKAKVEEAHDIAQNLFRPISRYYDEHEHEDPMDLIDTMWNLRLKGFLTGVG